MVRLPAVAGQFYPADAKTLTGMVDSMLASEEADGGLPSGTRVLGIQVPHAGYPYSGATAARAFRLLRGMDSATVVIIGTSHRVMIDKAAVYAKGAWRTPLGDVPIDELLAYAIIGESRLLVDMPDAHAAEHSIEVQLPFLQRVVPGLKIVPIMVLHPSYETCEQVGRTIARACAGKTVVLLASTDLYHGESYAEAKAVDSVTVSGIVGLNPKGLYGLLESGRAQACGGFGVVVAMVAAHELGAERAVVLAQTNSNDVMHERGGYCVGYSAIAFTAAAAVGIEESDDLTEAEQQSLLDIARRTVEMQVRIGKLPEITPLTERLREPRGVFVTLHERGELRGCIGYVEAYKPLFEAVQEMAVAASSEDPRFAPVEPEELGAIDLEITVLSPIRPLPSPDSVVVGKHGLVIRKGRRSGLLLPQVPVEQGWDRIQYLEGVCLKAGLSRDAYKDGDARLSCFTGQVFGEKKRGR